MIQYKRPSFFLASILFGSATTMGFISTQSLVLTVLKPVFVVYATVLASIIFSIVVNLTHIKKIKFSNYFTAALIVIALVNILFALPIFPDAIRGFMWYSVNSFINLYLSWAVSELVIRNFHPEAADANGDFYVLFYESGSIISCLIVLSLSQLNPYYVTYFSCILYILSALIIYFIFSSKKICEIRYDKKPHIQSAKKEQSLIKKLLIFFTIISVFYSFNSFMGDYLISIVLSENFSNYHEISAMVNRIMIINSLLRISMTILVFSATIRVHPSPILLLTIAAFFPGAVAAYSLLNNDMSSYIILYLVGIFCNDIFFWGGNNMITNFFPQELREKLKGFSAASYYIFSAILVGIFFWSLSSLDNSTMKYIMAVIYIICGVIALILMLFLRKELVETLFQLMLSKRRTSAIMAIFGLSFVKDKAYPQKVIDFLKNPHDDFVKKILIESCGYIADRSKLFNETIISQFHTTKESIQLAVLDFTQHSKTIYGTKLVLDILFNKQIPHSIKVREVASDVLAKTYGKMAIPMFLEELNSKDNRIKANAIEIIGKFKDKTTIEDFLNLIESPIPRIKANSLMSLSYFSSTRVIYRKGIKDMLHSTNSNLIASALYVIGRLQDQYFRENLLSFVKTSGHADPMIKRGLAYALTRLNLKEGFDLFGNLFSQGYKKGHSEDFMHFFSQLPLHNRLNLLEYFATNRDKFNIKNIFSHLNKSSFEYYEEIEFLEAIANE